MTEDLSMKVFQDRYALRDDDGNILEKTYDQMWDRVAKFVADGNKKEEKLFREALDDFKLIPAGRILAGAGWGKNLTFSNCYSFQIQDSRDSIYSVLKDTANILASGGGVGQDFSLLRPEGSIIKGIRGIASGPCSFISTYHASASTISQGGSRRGAALASLKINHPDILKFIRYKSENKGDWYTYNVSVQITNDFVEALEGRKLFQLYHPKGTKEQNIKIRAEELFNEICERAWQSGDPGLHMIDVVNEVNPSIYYEKLSSSNPCGEQFLPGDGGSCTLSSINLTKYVSDKLFDYENFENDTKIGIRFLDNILTLNYFPTEETKEASLRSRRIGLGILGLADAMLLMGYKYGSKESLQWFESVMKSFQEATTTASISLAKDRGSFPMFDSTKYTTTKFAKTRLSPEQRKDINKFGIRNADYTMIAPTGSLSLLAKVSSGIEPNFDYKYIRKDRLGEHTIIHPLYDGNEEIFVTANDCPLDGHLKIQEVAQKYLTNSLSKTINLPNSATIDDVKKAYKYAMKHGFKGITVFRDGCKEGVLVRDKKPEEKEYTRPTYLKGTTFSQQTPIGKAFITINENGSNKPFEVFINVGKAGSDIQTFGEAIGRLISLNLRTNGKTEIEDKMDEIIDQLKNIGGVSSVGMGKNKVKSLPDGISKVLQQYKVDYEEKIDEYSNKNICPQCGFYSLVVQEGCENCLQCLYSRC